MRERHIPATLLWLAALLVLSIATAAIGLAAFELQKRSAARTQANAITGGDWKRGEVAIARYGCGACHVVPGIDGAIGKVGPDLTGIGERAEIAGKLPNTPEAMVQWLMHPQTISPGSGMPDQAIGDRDARDIAAFLYALR